MSVALEEKQVWSARLAGRLRQIQANAADEDPVLRQEYMNQAVEREVSYLPEERKNEYLDALASHFPDAPALGGGSQTSPQVAGEEGKSQSLDGAIELLIRTADRGTGAERRKILEALERAGLLDGGQELEADEVPEELYKRLRLKPGAGLKKQPAMRLLGLLVETALTSDHLVWTLWQKLAPRSPVNRAASEDVRALLGRFLSGDTEVSFAEVTQALEKGRRINTSLLGAIGSLGRNLARRHAEKFSPDAIKEMVGQEGGNMWKSSEAKCWAKYVEISGDMSEEVLEKRVQDLLASYAEELMLGAQRPSSRTH